MVQRDARAGLLALALMLTAAVPASAEWQFKPFLDVTFGGETTFFDLDRTAGSRKVGFGVSGTLLGEVVGVEGDFGYVPGYFTGDDSSVPSSVSASRVTTLTGNVVVAMPRRLARYTLRPYFVGGGGLMHASSTLLQNIEGLSATLPSMDLGGGVTGFLSKRIGVNWDVRYFRSVGTGKVRGQSIAPEELSFWRVSVALAIRP